MTSGPHIHFHTNILAYTCVLNRVNIHTYIHGTPHTDKKMKMKDKKEKKKEKEEEKKTTFISN